MNVLFPVNGLGNRFKQEGYSQPKPLIKVGGEPMIVKVLKSFDFKKEDHIFIAYHRDLEAYSFERVIKLYLPELEERIHFYAIQEDTKGAAETVSVSLKKFGITDDVLIADCDVIYSRDILDSFRGGRYASVGASIDIGEEPLYSYIKLEGDLLTDIKEKEKISDFICCGLYYLRTVDINQLNNFIHDNTPADKELYLSGFYKYLLECGLKVSVATLTPDHIHCVGTPNQLQSYCGEHGELNADESLRVCFDIDKTLVTAPKVKGDYSTVLPIQENINYLRNLHNSGATIILSTARRMRTHGGNVAAVLADIGKVTIETLLRFDIPYDELHFGKPYAHHYIDDLSISAYGDLSKEIGFYFNHIEARDKHQISFPKRGEYTGLCVKEGKVVGESYWYSQIPKYISDKYCPKIFHLCPHKIVLETISDIPLSHLYVRGSVNETLLRNILTAVDDIHNSTPTMGNSPVDVNQNYLEKLNSRYDEIVQINPRAKSILDECLEHFLTYRASDERTTYIHGDPVFSNIFSDYALRLKFIDPRGKQGDKLSLWGDSLYDYAKIYQSIIGYDFVLLDVPLNDAHISEMRGYMDKQILDSFGEQTLFNIQMITKSLLVSCLIFHPKERSDKLLDLIDII